MKGKSRKISVFLLTMVNLATMLSIWNWSFMVEYGLSSLAFLFLVFVLFYLPTSLVSAELATGWPAEGGIYGGIGEAFGKKTGLLTVWLLWISHIVWYPTVLSIIGSTLLYCINPHYAENGWYNFFFILAVFWALTIFHMKGIQFSNLWSTLTVIVGTIFPGLLIVGLASLWFFLDRAPPMDFSLNAFIPNLKKIDQIVFMVGLLLAFAGIEINSMHANSIENPKKNYPRAVFYSSLVIFFFSIFGAFAIGIVLPKEEINFVTDIIKTFDHYFAYFEVPWMTPIIGVSVIIGAIGGLAIWIVGPNKALSNALLEVDASGYLTRENKHGAPVGSLVFQALLVSLLSFAFLLMPSMVSAFWIMTALSCQLYLIVYVLMFSAAIILKYKRPHVPREYVVPGKNFGMWLLSGLGFVASLLAFIVGFIPPRSLDVGSVIWYEFFLILSIVFFLLFPLTLRAKKEESAVEFLPLATAVKR